MKGQRRLTVNEAKTHVREVPDETFDFLGYTFGRQRSARTGKTFLGGRPGDKRIARVCDRISAITARRSLCLDVAQLNRVLRGWAGYFCLGPVSRAYRPAPPPLGPQATASCDGDPPAACERVNLLREPDAANPRVRFDERAVEMEHGQARETPADERAGQPIGPTYPTARPLDSTWL